MQRRSSLCSVIALSVAALGMVAHAQSATVVEQARAARLAQEPAHSVELLTVWLGDHPEDADAWLEHGFALTSLGDFPNARQSFGRTLRISPAYPDAELALARLDFFEGQFDAALRRLTRLEATGETRAFSDQVLAARLAGQKQELHAELTAEFSDLTNGLSDWTTVAGTLSGRLSNATALGGMVEHTRRFDREDIYAQVEVAHSFGSRWNAYAGLGGTPDADFRPRIILYAANEFEMLSTSRGAASVDGRLFASVADYASGSVVTVSPGLIARFGHGKARVGARLIALTDETGERRYGQAYDAGLELTQQLGLRAGWSDAPETSDGRTFDVRSASLSLRWSFSDRLAASVGAVSEERSAYDRTALSFSLSQSLE